MSYFKIVYIAGADPGFQVRGGGTLKKIVPSRGGCKHFWGISCEKSRFYAKKSYFFQFWGGVAPPAGSAPALDAQDTRQRQTKQKNITQKTNKMNKLYKNVVRCLCITKQN